jgi:hypothetical protein
MNEILIGDLVEIRVFHLGDDTLTVSEEWTLAQVVGVEPHQVITQVLTGKDRGLIQALEMAAMNQSWHVKKGWPVS